MKKNFLFLMILVLGVALTGCGGGGATDAPVAGAVTAKKVLFTGTVNPAKAGAIGAAPGRNLQLAASTMTVEVEDFETGELLGSSPVTAGTGAYSCSTTIDKKRKLKLNVKKGTKKFMGKFLGTVVVPQNDNRTVGNIKIDENSTAKAAIVETNKSNPTAIIKLTEQVLDPDSDTDLTGGTSFDKLIDKDTTGLAAEVAELEDKLEIIMAALDNDFADFDKFVDESGIASAADIMDGVMDTMKEMESDAALKTAMDALTFDDIVLPSGATLDLDNVEGAGIDIFNETTEDTSFLSWDSNPFDDDFDFLNNLPEISAVYVNDQPLYMDGEVMTGVTINTLTPTFMVNFTMPMYASPDAYANFYVTESQNGMEITQFVYFGGMGHYMAPNRSGGSVYWGDVFDKGPNSTYLNGVTSFTFSVLADGALSLTNKADYHIELVDWYGFYTMVGSDSFDLFPTDVEGFFSTN